MNHRLRIALALAGACLCSTQIWAQATPADTEANLGQLRERIETLKSRIEQTSDARGVQDRELRLVEQRIGDLARRLRVLVGRLERQNERLEVLRDREAEQVSALDQQRAALARQVRQAYAVGRQERLKLLLNQQDPATLARVMAYYDYINRNRAARLIEIREAVEELRDTQSEIRQESAKLESLRTRQLAERDELELIRTQRQAIITELSKALKDQGIELTRLQEDEKELSDLLLGLRQALSDIPAPPSEREGFRQARGRLPWPTEGKVAARFGGRKIGNLRWEGVLIHAAEGQEIKAVHPGRVAYADWLRGYGLLIILDHGDGYMTLYGHNQSLFKEAGDWVGQGEPIAAVGASGGQTVPGIYFEIRYRQRPVDPLRWCRNLQKGRTSS